MHETNHICIGLQDSGQATINGPIGNIKSNIFSTSTAINPLIAASSALLTITPLENIDSLTLQHEIRAFEGQAQLNKYSTQIILDARYLLCAFLNEQLPQLNLLNKTEADTHFFTILEQSLSESARNIDLLELGYLCLSLGFHGKYQQLQQQNELGIFIDQLYQIIQKQRGEPQPYLKHYNKPKKTTWSWRLPPWWITAIAGATLALFIYIPHSQKLDHQAKLVVQHVNQVMAQS